MTQLAVERARPVTRLGLRKSHAALDFGPRGGGSAPADGAWSGRHPRTGHRVGRAGHAFPAAAVYQPVVAGLAPVECASVLDGTLLRRVDLRIVRAARGGRGRALPFPQSLRGRRLRALLPLGVRRAVDISRAHLARLFDLRRRSRVSAHGPNSGSSRQASPTRAIRSAGSRRPGGPPVLPESRPRETRRALAGSGPCRVS